MSVLCFLSVLGVIEPSSDKDWDVFISCLFVLIVYRYKINLFKSNQISNVYIMGVSDNTVSYNIE